jgi:hypothetical protein
MRELARRISHIEATQRHKRAEGHWIPVLFSPWDLPDERRDEGLRGSWPVTVRPIAQGSSSGLCCPRKRHLPRYGLHGRQPTMRRGEAAMRDARRRLERLEYAHLWRLAANAGKPYGFSTDDILDEARRVLALPDAEQRQVLHRLYAELNAQEALELDAIRRRHAAILRRAR